MGAGERWRVARGRKTSTEAAAVQRALLPHPCFAPQEPLPVRDSRSIFVPIDIDDRILK